MARQFVVQLEDCLGALAHLARAFAARSLDIIRFACVGTGVTACTSLALGALGHPVPAAART
jgi:hypothetical protein